MNLRSPPERSRRQFLAALGATLIAPAVHAASPQAPKVRRFIGVYAPHGCAYELWRPGDGFDLAYPDCSLSPFDDVTRYGRSLKQNLLVLDGLDLASGISGGTVGHDAARVILTGASGGRPGASLDQALAVEHLLGAETPETSLVLAVGNDGTEIGNCVSYGSLGIPLPKEINPAALFDRLFGQPLTEKARSELEASRRRGLSALDFARDDLRRLNSRASRRARGKLDQHHTALREIEKRLAPRALKCDVPARPVTTGFPRVKSYGGGEPYFEHVTELLTDLLVRAMACDVTRFATLMLADLSRTGAIPGYPTDVHFSVAHHYAARSKTGPGDPESWRLLATQNRHSYGQVAYLLNELANNGLLDESLVMVCSDMGDVARHSSRNVPVLVAGGAGSSFRFGRHIDYRAIKGDGLKPHNHLLVALLQQFGVSREHFGNANDSHVTHGLLTEL